MKRFLSLLIIFIYFIFTLVGCSKSNDCSEIVVFAASSMTESLTEIADLYTKTNPNIKITFNFDSSGTLKTQIKEGAICDVFVSASQKPMDEINYVLEDTRFNLLENKVVLVVPDNNPIGLKSFDDMANYLNDGDIILAIGNQDVPVGEYTLNIFDYYNIDVDNLNEMGKLSYGSNVKEVTTQVSESMVDCGIVYQTDAKTAKLNIVDTATDKMCGRVIYPACVISTSTNINESKRFLEFLKFDECSNVFKKYGFTPLT